MQAVDSAAATPTVAGVFAAATSSERGAEAFGRAQDLARQLGTAFPRRHPREADLVVLTDADGHALARNVDRTLDRNRDLRAEYEVVRFALEGGGRTARDFLKYDQQRWFDVVVSPVRRDGALLGLLLVGYEIADSIAAEDARDLGVDVGYLIRDGNAFVLHSLSFGTQAEKDDLLRWVNRPGANPVPERASDPITLNIAGQEYRVSARAMPGIFSGVPARAHAGYLVMQSATAARAPSGSVALPVLLLALLGALVIAGLNVVVVGHMLGPIEQIEEGLLRIVNGDRDHRIEIQHPELGGIVYRVNQLVSELTGADEETDDAGHIQHAHARQPPSAQAIELPITIDDASIANSDGAVAQALGAEQEDAYYRRLHSEYVAAMRALGASDGGVTAEQFAETVRSNEQALAQKYSLTLVRFQARTIDGQITFVAVGIR